MMSPAYFTRAH